MPNPDVYVYYRSGSDRERILKNPSLFGVYPGQRAHDNFAKYDTEGNKQQDIPIASSRSDQSGTLIFKDAPAATLAKEFPVPKMPVPANIYDALDSATTISGIKAALKQWFSRVD